MDAGLAGAREVVRIQSLLAAAGVEATCQQAGVGAQRQAARLRGIKDEVGVARIA